MIGYFIYKCWSEMPFWQKAMWAGILISGIEECQKEDRYRLDPNSEAIIDTEYRTNTSDYRGR